MGASTVAGMEVPLAQVGVLEEIQPTMVTGTLWTAELKDTTASVSVLPGSFLQDGQLGQFENLVGYLPNLTQTGGTSRSRYFQIRGVGENSQFEGETPDSAVQFLIDDLDFTGIGSIGGLFDLEQVEVLRGPQAGAFGANAAAGVIRLVTVDPRPFWSGYLEGGIGNKGLRESGAALGGPLLSSDPERLTFRLAVQRNLADGFISNRFLGREDTNEVDEFFTRLKLRYLPGSDWVWEGGVFYAKLDNGYDEFALSGGDFETFSDEPGRDEQESIGFSIKGAYEGGKVARWTTTTTFSGTESVYSFDADWTPESYRGFLKTDRNRNVFTQEVRLDSQDTKDALGWLDRWTLGVYYRQLEEETDVFYRDGDLGGGPLDFGVVEAQSRFETNEAAVFAQGARDISERTRLVLGLRGEIHKVDFSSESTGAGYYEGLLGSGRSEKEDFLWGGKVTLEHDLSRRHTIFGSLARGYKAGGANSPTFRIEGQPLTYDAETLWNGEIGWRGSAFDDRLTGALTAFYLYREDPQLRDSVGAGGFFQYLTVNGSRAEHYGLEAEGSWDFGSGWKVDLGLGLLEARRDPYDDPGGRVEGRRLSNAPRWSGNARLSYDGGPENWFGFLGLQGKGSSFESNSHDEKRSSFVTLDGAIGCRWGGWTFTLWGRNLLDERYEERLFFFDNGEGVQRYEALADPRQYGVKGRYAF
ncbi:MAG: TonB-dependent receptor [Puniceicoccaceae bacterium]